MCHINKLSHMSNIVLGTKSVAAPVLLNQLRECYISQDIKELKIYSRESALPEL